MTVYIIAQIDIHDRAEYAKYEAGFMEAFTPFAGKLLAVDEAPIPFEGEWSATRTVLIEFPNEPAARAWYDSDEYQKIVQHRWAASDARGVILQGMEAS